MARIKEVFTSNSQVAHIWAQQVQPAGHTKDFYFTDWTDLYSYGGHYLAAKIHEIDGKRVALIRSDSYSNSTSKHLYHARQAVTNLMPYFEVPDVENIKSDENFNYFNDRVIDQITRILTTNKVTNEYSIQSKIDYLIDYELVEANDYFKFVGYPLIKIPDSLIEVMREHLEARLARYKELNTPEMIAKKEAIKQRKEELKAKRDEERKIDTIKLWREGQFVSTGQIKLPYDILRVKGDQVQTSSGASVPLSHALRLLTLIETGKVREGERVGHFTFEAIFDSLYQGNDLSTNDKIIKIGCHKIKLSEAQDVLNPYREQRAL